MFLQMRLLSLVALLLPALAVIPDDEVKSMPGWTGSLPSKMFSGYIDVGNQHHVHYWFVESENDPKNDPVVLWVQGGPGGSSLMGMFTENMGPFALNLDSMKTKPPTLFRSQSAWTKAANMLFWEAPAGVGFSYCDGDCPHWNDTTFAIDQAEFLCKWFAAYPEFKNNSFFIWGESYAGVYIPVTVLQLLDSGLCGGSLKLKGVAIGNGCTGTDAGTCSPGREVYTIDQMYMQGMFSQKTKYNIDMECADSIAFTKPNPRCATFLKQASEEAGPFNLYNVHDTCGPPTDTLTGYLCQLDPTREWACNHAGLSNLIGSQFTFYEGTGARLYKSGFLAEPIHEPENYKCGGEDALAAYLSQPDVQKAIHVEVSKVTHWPGTRIHYTRSFPNLLKSPGYPDLIKHMRVLIYSGDFDADIPHRGTEEWTRGLDYPVKEGTRPWVLANGQLIGRVISYDVPTEFTYATISGAGHMVPTFKAIEGFELFTRFLKGGPY